MNKRWRLTPYVNEEPNRQGGFTIVELMIATIVFSVIMLLAAGVVIRFTSNFQRGVTQTTTQNAARSIIDLVSQQLQFTGSTNGFGRLTANGTSKGYCILGVQYSYVLGRQLGNQTGQTRQALIEREGTGDGCGGNAQDISGGSAVGKELLAQNMRILTFDIDTDTTDTDLYKMKIKLAYGDDDLFCVSDATTGPASCGSKESLTNVAGLDEASLAKLQCKNQTGSQFCAVSELSTTVQRRL